MPRSFQLVCACTYDLSAVKLCRLQRFFRFFRKSGGAGGYSYGLVRPLSMQDRSLHRSARLAQPDATACRRVASWHVLATRKRRPRMLRSGIVGPLRPSFRYR